MMLACVVLAVAVCTLTAAEEGTLRSEKVGCYENDDLMYAITFCSKNDVKVLLNQEAKINRLTKCRKGELFALDRCTALHVAVRNRKVDIARELIRNGAGTNVLDAAGISPLMDAVKSNDSAMVTLLLQNMADSNFGVRWSQKLEYPIIAAVNNRDASMVEVLLRYGAATNVTDYPGQYGHYPLLLMVNKNDTAIVSLLLQYGANVNEGQHVPSYMQAPVPFLAAAEQGYSEIVRLFLRRGVPVNLQDGEGRTALYFALQGGHLSTATLLLQNGSDANLGLRKLSGTKVTAVYPLIIASKRGYEPIVRLLVQKGANVTSNHEQDWPGYSALHAAAENGFIQIVRFLIANGADVNARTQQGSSSSQCVNETVLHRAAREGHSAIVELLLEHGANVNSKTADTYSCSPGSTALHFAAELGNIRVVSALLRKGVDSTLRNKAGKLPVDLARGLGISAVVALL